MSEDRFFDDPIRFPKELRELLAASQEKIDLSYQRFVRAVFVEGLRSLGLLTDKIASLGMGHASIENVKPNKAEKVATFKDLEDLMREVRFMIQEATPIYGNSLGDEYEFFQGIETIQQGDLLTAGNTGSAFVEAWPEIIGKPVTDFVQGKMHRYVARKKPPYSADNLPLNPPGLEPYFFYMGLDEVITEDDMITVSGWDAPDYQWGRATKETIGYGKTLRELRERHKDAFAARSFETSLPSDGTSQQEAAGGVFEL